jgi:hypothetical protein
MENPGDGLGAVAGQPNPAQESGKLLAIEPRVRSTGRVRITPVDSPGYNAIPSFHRLYHYCYLI